jgi:hypothetical protein
MIRRERRVTGPRFRCIVAGEREPSSTLPWPASRSLVEVMLQVHGKQPVNDLATIVSGIDDVDAVLVNDANAVDE